MANIMVSSIEGIPDMTLRELCEAASDKDVSLAATSLASAAAAFGAGLLSRASCISADTDISPDSLCKRAQDLCDELQGLTSRLDAADEMIRSNGGKPSDIALSAAADAALALLEASYYGQSLAVKVSESATRSEAIDIAAASMLLDCAAGSALMCASKHLADMSDEASVKKAEELIWAITHDRIGSKKKVLDVADSLIRRQQ